MKQVVKVEGVDVRLGRTQVLKSANLELRTGELTLLLGRNGAGKSTLMRLLTGQLLPQRGSVRVLESDPGREAAIRGRIAFVPSSPDLPKWMSLHDAAKFEERVRGRWSWERLERIAGALDTPLDRPVSKLSKGQAATAMLALAFAAEPDLLLLDEPFSGLDPVSQDVFGEVVADEKARGAAILLCTHELTHAQQVC
ncbi:MAG: ABC transporter ATP-binding protein, partial [Planctomycetota bacterium]